MASEILQQQISTNEELPLPTIQTPPQTATMANTPTTEVTAKLICNTDNPVGSVGDCGASVKHGAMKSSAANCSENETRYVVKISDIYKYNYVVKIKCKYIL